MSSLSNYINWQTLGIACGVGILGYCAYFDHKRRNDPNYRDNVRARREQQKIDAENRDRIELPPLDDQEAVQKFIVSKMEAGEEFIQAGDIDRGANYLAYAIALCPQPDQVIKYMRETLPTSAFVKLVTYYTNAKKVVDDARRSRFRISEEDVE